MILFCATECLGNFGAGFPKLEANAIYGRQTLFYCKQTLFIAGKHFFAGT
jgi:hypothetical protein